MFSVKNPTFPCRSVAKTPLCLAPNLRAVAPWRAKKIISLLRSFEGRLDNIFLPIFRS